MIGTFHFADPRIDRIAAGFSDIIANADLVMFESTMEEMLDLGQRIRSNPALIILPHWESLPSMLPEATWDRLAIAARSNGIQPWMLSRMQPWFAFAILSVPTCVTQMNNSNNGLDRQLDGFAAEHGVPVASLEPVDSVQAMFVGSSDEEMAALFDVTAVATPDATAGHLASLEAYLAERSADMIPLSLWQATARGGLDPDRALAGWAMIEEVVLNRRNHAWIPRILSREEEQLVVAVGALHLSGEEGVLNLLAQAGYALTRAPF